MPPPAKGPEMSAVPSKALRSLPLPLTPLVGREREVEALVGLLRRNDVRLLTLTGPGGVGKTRLALQVATGVAGAFPDGVRFVGLAPIADPGLVAPTIARALSIREAGDEPLEARLKAFLRDKRRLLVLDNFEQVVAAAPLVAALLAACPGPKILVTSRVRLRVSGEREYPVPPLGVTDQAEHAPVEEVAASGAVRLFIERAQAVKPDFELTAENAAAVADVCRRLDGLPLAIELAAARVKVLPPPALLVRLERRLPLLTGGGRDLPARQRTMRDTIAWSYDLLSVEEQALFRRLAVFVGGFDLEAAEAVAAGRGGLGSDPFEGIASLADKSLLRQEIGPGGAPRLRMLETIREFGLEQLAESDEAADVVRRHAAFFLAFAERTTPETLPGDPAAAFDLLAADHDNLRAAFDGLCDASTAGACLRLAAACAPYWYARGHVREGWERLHRALAIAGPIPTPARGHVLNYLGQLAITTGNLRAASAFGHEGLAVWDAVGDPGGRASALHVLAMVEEHHLRWDTAAELFEELIETWRRLEEPFHLGRAVALRAGVAYGQGDVDQAIALEEEAGALFRELGHRRWVGLTDWYLGMFASSQRRFAEAARRYRDSLRSLIEAGDSVWLFKPVAGLAAVAAQCDRPDAAARLLGAVDELLRRTGARLLPFDRPIYEQAAAGAQGALGAAEFAAIRREGRDLTLEDLRDEAETIVSAAEEVVPAPRRRGGPAVGLTAREQDVLHLLAEGKTDREIAAALFLSRRTINAHVANILGQLGVHSRRDAVAHARNLGLLPVTRDRLP